MARSTYSRRGAGRSQITLFSHAHRTVPFGRAHYVVHEIESRRSSVGVVARVGS